MKAYAMIGPYTEGFNTMAVANQLRASTNNFAQLPWANQHLSIKAGQALFLYGGRTALLDALAPLGDLKIVGNRWEPLALFRAERKVAGGTKTKQLLMLAPVPNGIPTGLRGRLIPITGQETNDGIFLRNLNATIGNL